MLIKRLYKHRKTPEDEDTDDATEVFKQRLESSEDFEFSFASYLINSIIIYLCCCSKRLTTERANKMKKIAIARERLQGEQELERLLRLNRLSNIMHKISFLKRQREVCDYSRSYVIGDDDILAPKVK